MKQHEPDNKTNDELGCSGGVSKNQATKPIICLKFKKGGSNTLVGKKTSFIERATTTKLMLIRIWIWCKFNLRASIVTLVTSRLRFCIRLLFLGFFFLPCINTTGLIRVVISNIQTTNNFAKELLNSFQINRKCSLFGKFKDNWSILY